METLNTIAKALTLGALARQWAHSHQSVFQCYLELKGYLQQHYPGVKLGKLEESPQSGGIQFILKEDLSNVVAYRDEILLEKAQQLIEAVNQHNPELLDKLTPDV
jgi:hypothetical protein